VLVQHKHFQPSSSILRGGRCFTKPHHSAMAFVGSSVSRTWEVGAARDEPRRSYLTIAVVSSYITKRFDLFLSAKQAMCRGRLLKCPGIEQWPVIIVAVCAKSLKGSSFQPPAWRTSRTAQEAPFLYTAHHPRRCTGAKSDTKIVYLRLITLIPTMHHTSSYIVAPDV